MVQAWQKPKYAPFEEEAEDEQGSSALLLLESGDEETPADDPVVPTDLGKSGDRFQVDLLDSWFKP